MLVRVLLFTRWKLRNYFRRRTASVSDRGFALLIVLVVLVTLSLMLGAVVTATRHYADETGARLANLRLRAAIDGAFATFTRDLTREQLSIVEAGSETVKIGNIAVNLTVRPEASKVDINYADPNVIGRLLRVSGVGQEQTNRISEEIVEWRSERTADHHREADYIGAGRHYRPPHKAFLATSELALILDGGQDLVDCLEPDITVYSRSRNVDLSNASERVRQAVRQDEQDATSPLSGFSVVGGASGRPDLLEISATAEDSDHQIKVSRQIIVRVTGDTKNPIWVLADSAPIPNQSRAATSCSRLASQWAQRQQ